MAVSAPRNDVKKTNVMFSQKKRRALKRLMLDWEDEYDLPIELKESHCVEAAFELIIKAATPELIDAEAKEKNYSEEDTKDLHESYKWFMEKYIDVLENLIEERAKTDGRRTNKFQNIENA